MRRKKKHSSTLCDLSECQLQMLSQKQNKKNILLFFSDPFSLSFRIYRERQANFRKSKFQTPTSIILYLSIFKEYHWNKTLICHLGATLLFNELAFKVHGYFSIRPYFKLTFVMKAKNKLGQISKRVGFWVSKITWKTLAGLAFQDAQLFKIKKVLVRLGESHQCTKSKIGLLLKVEILFLLGNVEYNLRLRHTVVAIGVERFHLEQ